MIFDDSFFLLSDDDDQENKDTDWASVDDDNAENSVESDNATSEFDSASEDSAPAASESSNRGRWTGGMLDEFADGPFSSDSNSSVDESYTNTVSDSDYAIESDLVMPSIKPTKAEDAKPTILVIDDDFATLDLMKIYFARGYDYVSFSGPREAIFYLNEHIVDLIFLDCYIHTIKAARVVDIIHSYKEFANVPIIYLCDDYEYGAISRKLPNGVSGVVQRPVSRKSVQEVLDRHLPKQS